MQKFRGGLVLRLMDFVYQSTVGVREIPVFRGFGIRSGFARPAAMMWLGLASPGGTGT